MFLTRLSISRPVLVRMVLLLIIVFGIYAYRAMPRYLDPDLTIGEALIVTFCPGYSPEEMEKLVTNKIQDELDGIAEIRRHESYSFEGTSKIHVFFNTRLSEYEIDQAMQEIRNAVDRVEDLPEETKVPRIIELEIALFPVCMVGLAGDIPLMQLQDIAKDIADDMANIEGVSEVEISGERENEIWVELDPRKMSAYSLSIAQVAEGLNRRTKNLPGGTIEMGDHEVDVRMLGEPRSPERLGEIALRSGPAGTVHLRDIAVITPSLERPRTLTFIDEKPGLILAVKRKKNTNMVRIVDEVKIRLKDLPRQYPGLKSTLYFDQSMEIKKRIRELQTNAMLGLVAVFFALWISMGIRNAAFASMGIPVSFLLTFCFMRIFNLSIDAVTLFGLILVLGIIVDDAIVVLDNIFRYVEMGEPLTKATVEGSREVLAPVIASVTTTMAAFFPLLFVVGGVIGRYLAILPKVVIFALSASLFEVFCLLPSHVTELAPKAGAAGPPKRRLDIFEPVRKVYYPILRSILRHRYISVLVIVLSTGLAFFLYFQADFVMFPKSDVYPRFNIYFDLPVGSTLERTRDTLMALNAIVKEKVGPDLDAPIAIAGMKEVNYEPIIGKHFGLMIVLLKGPEDRKQSVVDIMERLRVEATRVLKSHGATGIVLERLLEGPPVGADVDLKIQSPSWGTSADLSRRLRVELGRHRGIVDIQDDFSRDKQFLEVTVDEAKAKQMGLDQGLLVMAVQSAFHGFPVAMYNQGEEEQEVKLFYLPEYRRNFDDLVDLKLAVPGHGEVSLQDVAQIRLVPGFHNIYHYNGKQTVRLTAGIQDATTEEKGLSRFLSNVSGDRMTAVRANQIAQEAFERIRAEVPGARLIAGGLQEETHTSLVELGYAAAMALFLIFFILSVQFNSFTQPFIIMITIPFVSLGVLVGLLVSNNPLTFITLIGLLTLTGIVVNDSLVLIDFINRYKAEGSEGVFGAVVRACHVRMRPIILTSITTIVGLAPMALGIGGKSVFWAPLATAIMWGLAFSTVLVLTMVPAYYLILEDVRYLVRHRRRRKAETRSQIDQAFELEEVRRYVK